MTPMLRATQIGSGTLCDRCLPWRSVPGMSAAGTHTKRRKKRGGGGSREKQGEQGGKDGWHKRKENRGEEENRKEVCVCPRKSDVRPRRDEIHSVMFLSDSNQSDTTSLDIPQAVTPTLADPGEEQEDSHALQPSPLVHFSKISSEQAARLAE